jgi:ABC-2 type transport system permease protein
MLVATGLVSVYLSCLTGTAITIGAIFRDRLKATQFCMMMSLPTFITAGYVWPLFKLPVFVGVLAKALWPLIYLVSPLRDFIIKGVFPSGFSANFLELLVFGAVWMGIGLYASKQLFRSGEVENI